LQAEAIQPLSIGIENVSVSDKCVIRTVFLANVFASKQRLEGFADGLISGPGKESQDAALALEQAADGLGDGKGSPVPVFLPVLESPCVAQEHGPIVHTSIGQSRGWVFTTSDFGNAAVDSKGLTVVETAKITKNRTQLSKSG